MENNMETKKYLVSINNCECIRVIIDSTDSETAKLNALRDYLTGNLDTGNAEKSFSICVEPNNDNN